MASGAIIFLLAVDCLLVVLLLRPGEFIVLSRFFFDGLFKKERQTQKLWVLSCNQLKAIKN
jgi:hypothetical protein